MKQPNMNITLEYKGYDGSVEFSEQDRVFYGKVKGIRSLISYEAKMHLRKEDTIHRCPWCDSIINDLSDTCKHCGGII